MNNFKLKVNYPSNTCKQLEFIQPYLYQVWYDQLDYTAALNYFKDESNDLRMGACSSVRCGNFFGRNFDWKYDDQAEFIVIISGTEDRYSSIGVAKLSSELPEQSVRTGAPNDLYDIVPFLTLDGINSQGVTVSTNVVPANERGNNRFINTTGTSEICTRMLIRMILDKCDSAINAVNLIKSTNNIFHHKSLIDQGYEQHFMVADDNETYLIEFIEGNIVAIKMNQNKSYMTNFHLSGVVFNQDGTVLTPATRTEDKYPTKTNLITPHGAGLERYNLISRKFSSCNTLHGMLDLMSDLYYTNNYLSSPTPALPRWDTEMVGLNNLTVDSYSSDFTPVHESSDQVYKSRSRKLGNIWQTVHSSVYDISRRKLYLRNQESNRNL